MITVVFLLLGISPLLSQGPMFKKKLTIRRLDADFTIAPNGSFPTLPAGQNQQGQIKLSMDNEGLIYNADGSFWISDEYGRISPHQLYLH
jgi:hypothetical protein